MEKGCGVMRTELSAGGVGQLIGSRKVSQCRTFADVDDRHDTYRGRSSPVEGAGNLVCCVRRREFCEYVANAWRARL